MLLRSQLAGVAFQHQLAATHDVGTVGDLERQSDVLLYEKDSNP